MIKLVQSKSSLKKGNISIFFSINFYGISISALYPEPRVIILRFLQLSIYFAIVSRSSVSRFLIFSQNLKSLTD